MLEDFYKSYQKLLFGKNKTLFYVKLKPASKRSEIKGIVNIADNYKPNLAIYISLKEKPENNKANLALISIFYKKFNLHVSINSGQNSRLKVLEIVK